MGYFSNNAEGANYERGVCSKCRHYPHDGKNEEGCPVWWAHLLHTSADGEDVKYILDSLIPRNEKGENEICAMFISRERIDAPGQTTMF